MANPLCDLLTRFSTGHFGAALVKSRSPTEAGDITDKALEKELDVATSVRTHSL
jgi:hypothetical protein